MNVQVIGVAATVAISAANLGLWALTYFRTGRWRETDDARELVRRVDDAEDRLTKIEAVQTNGATKAEVAGLKSELHGVRELVERTESGVRRIESHLMRFGT